MSYLSSPIQEQGSGIVDGDTSRSAVFHFSSPTSPHTPNVQTHQGEKFADQEQRIQEIELKKKYAFDREIARLEQEKREEITREVARLKLEKEKEVSHLVACVEQEKKEEIERVTARLKQEKKEEIACAVAHVEQEMNNCAKEMHEKKVEEYLQVKKVEDQGKVTVNGMSTKPRNMSPGPIGYIYHYASKKIVHPCGGAFNPKNNTRLVLHDSKHEAERLQVRFIPMNGDFGYIEHPSSGKIVHPYGGRASPRNDTKLVYHSDRHAGALFKFDVANYEIVHFDGKKWHPKGGRPDPANETTCVLHSDTHTAAKFFFGDIDGNLISPYPEEKGATSKVIDT